MLVEEMPLCLAYIYRIKLNMYSVWQKYMILCFWFRAPLIYINNCPMRRSTKQSIYYSASSLYMFRVLTTPIIRSTQNSNYSLRYGAATSSLATLQGGSRTVPEAVVTVLCTPDNGYSWHSKHVEWTCRIINRLLCVASCWKIINIDQRCTER